MVVLKKGDWVLVLDTIFEVEQVLNGHVFLEGQTGFVFAHECTPLPEGLTPLLLSSNQQGELNE